jgi:ribosomal protein S18 acetylase RimI-like enzyme
MSGFQVREARHSDRVAIGRLWHELMEYHRALDPRFVVAPDGEQKYVRHVQEMIRSRDARVLVAEETSTLTIVGYVIGEIQHRPPMALPGIYGFVSDIYVTAAWRQHGVGRALVEELKRWFISRKAGAMELYIADANPTAVEFWQAMGMKPFLRLMHTDL